MCVFENMPVHKAVALQREDLNWFYLLMSYLIPAHFTAFILWPWFFLVRSSVAGGHRSSSGLVHVCRTYTVANDSAESVTVRPLRRVAELREIGESIFASALAPPTTKLEVPYYIHLLFGIYLGLYLDVHWYHIKTILDVGIPVLSPRSVIALSPLVVVLWYIALRTVPSWARYLWHVYTAQLYWLLVTIAQAHPASKIFLNNLDTIFSPVGQQRSTRTSRSGGDHDQGHHEPNQTRKIETGTGALSLYRISSIDQECTHRGDFVESIQKWIDQYDPANNLVYIIPPTCNIPCKNGSLYSGWQTTISKCGAGHVVVIPSSDSEIPGDILQGLVTSGIHRFDAFLRDRRKFREFYQSAADAGFEVTLSANFFPGVDVRIGKPTQSYVCVAPG
jgi:hypothetical protein